MNDSVRLFFALPLPDNVKDAVAAEQARLRDVAAVNGVRPKWALPEQWHVTAKFLGSVSRDRIAALQDAAADVASRHSAVTASLGPTSVFGRRRLATVLFLTVVDDGALSRLATALEGATAALGHARETRKYVPHVTLARFREPTLPTPFLDGRVVTTDPVRFESLRLYESIHSASGSGATSEGGRYTRLAEWALSSVSDPR